MSEWDLWKLEQWMKTEKSPKGLMRRFETFKNRKSQFSNTFVNRVIYSNSLNWTAISIEIFYRQIFLPLSNSWNVCFTYNSFDLVTNQLSYLQLNSMVDWLSGLEQMRPLRIRAMDELKRLQTASIRCEYSCFVFENLQFEASVAERISRLPAALTVLRQG